MEATTKQWQMVQSATNVLGALWSSVSNRALWHSKNTGGALQGTLKDFSYLFTSNLEVYLELNCFKYPKSVYLLNRNLVTQTCF